MKLSPYVSTLHLYDVVSTAGVAADVSHINTPAKASGCTGALRSWRLVSQVVVKPQPLLPLRWRRSPARRSLLPPYRAWTSS